MPTYELNLFELNIDSNYSIIWPFSKSPRTINNERVCQQVKKCHVVQ